MEKVYCRGVIICQSVAQWPKGGGTAVGDADAHARLFGNTTLLELPHSANIRVASTMADGIVRGTTVQPWTLFCCVKFVRVSGGRICGLMLCVGG